MREAELYLAGCLHVGSAAANENLIREVADHVAAKENRFLLLMGDAIDGINVNDHRFDPRELPEWLRARDLGDFALFQARRVAELLKAIPSDRILGAIEGNHARKIRTAYYLDAHRVMCDLLKTPNAGETCFIRWNFKGRDAGEGSVTLYAEHGAGGAGTPEAVLTQLKKRATNHPGADAYLGSHHHSFGFSTKPMAGFSAEKGTMSYHEPIVATSGTFMEYYGLGADCYGETFHSPVKSMGPTKLRVAPWGFPRTWDRAGQKDLKVGVVHPWWA